jgi:hypothetical protein
MIDCPVCRYLMYAWTRIDERTRDMISTLRDGIQKTGYKYVIWTMLFIFIVSGTGLFVGFFSGKNVGVVARINNDPITQLELRNKTHVFDQMIKDIKQQFKEYAPYFLQAQGLTGNPQDMALSELVREKLLLQACASLNLHGLSVEYVAEKLANQTFVMQNLGMLVPPYLYNSLHVLDERILTNYLRRQNISVAQFESEIESALKQYFINTLLPTAVFVLPKEVQEAWDQEHASRVFKVLEIDLDDYVTKVQSKAPAENAFKDYFTLHNTTNQRYWTTERRSGTVWKFTPETYGITVSAAEVKTAYENNKKRWADKGFESVRKELEKELLQAKFNARFSADAQRIIQQSSSGELEQFAKKHAAKKTTLSDELFKPESATIAKLFSLKSPGKMGTVVAAHEGFIVVLDVIKERVSRPFSDVRAEVERDFYQEKASQELVSDLKKFAQQATTEAFALFGRENDLVSRTIKITGSDAKAWASAEKEGLPVARMKKMIHPGAAFAQMTQEGAVIVLLESFKQADSVIDDAQKASLIKKLRAQKLNLVSAAFIASLQNNAIIDYIGIQK